MYAKLFFRFHGNRFKQMHFGGVFCTDTKSDGSFVPVVLSKTIPVQCFQTCKAWLHSTVLFRSSFCLYVNLSHNAMPKGGKIGRKQSVLKKNCQKKKSKFKGVQKTKESAHGTGEKRCSWNHVCRWRWCCEWTDSTAAPLKFLFFGFIRFLPNLAQLLMKGCSTNLLRLFYFWWIQLMIFQVELFTKLCRCYGNTICWKPKLLNRFVGECV